MFSVLSPIVIPKPQSVKYSLSCEKRFTPVTDLILHLKSCRGGGRSIIGGLIFIYSCSQTVKTKDFKRN